MCWEISLFGSCALQWLHHGLTTIATSSALGIPVWQLFLQEVPATCLIYLLLTSWPDGWNLRTSHPPLLSHPSAVWETLESGAVFLLPSVRKWISHFPSLGRIQVCPPSQTITIFELCPLEEDHPEWVFQPLLFPPQRVCRVTGSSPEHPAIAYQPLYAILS